MYFALFSLQVWYCSCLRWNSPRHGVARFLEVIGAMQRQPLAVHHRDRVTAGLPFVESLARRVASSMPHSIELSDLVQDGMIGDITSG